jgi:LPS-assembly protein
VIAALLLALAAAAEPAPQPIEVLEAGKVEYDVATHRGHATGGVVLRRGLVIVRADEATYDANTGVVDATGHVLLTEPGRVVSGTALHAVLDGPYEAHDVVAFLKTTPLDLSTCRTLDEARAKGANAAAFGGSQVTGTAGDPRFEVDRARITLCDCGGGAPSWELRARHASVTPGKGALLTWPVLYVTPRFLFVHEPVPVMIFPVLYLPLSQRQTGLLMPDIAFGGNPGFGVFQPFFLTLGPSYDATFTPHYYFGPSAGDVAKLSRDPRGPGLGLELRWAPVEGARGALRFSILHQLSSAWPGGAAPPPDMNRLSLSIGHDQRFSDATYFKLDALVVGDAYYVADLTTNPLLRTLEYRRSAVALTSRTRDLLLEADAAYHLPLVYLDACGGPTTTCSVRAPFGAFGADIPVFHRLPSASITLLPTPLAGPLQVTATAGLARFAPLRGFTGDEGPDGIGAGERGWSVSFIDPGERDGRWEPGERLAVTRAATRLELRAPFTVGHVLEVDPWVAGTALGYAFEAAKDPQADARATGGLTLSTRLARTYGTGASAVKHILEPRVELRFGTPQLGPALPAYAYDELDVAPLSPPPTSFALPPPRNLTAEPGAFQQARLSLRSRLSAMSGAALDLTLGQDLDLGAGRASETWAHATFGISPVSGYATARFRAFGAERPAGTPPASVPSWLDTFTELRAGAFVSDPRGDNLHASFVAVGTGGSPAILAGLEPFFDARPIAVDGTAAAGVGVTGRLSGATVSYDAALNPRPSPTAVCPNDTSKRIPTVYAHSGTLVWDSPCHCWKAAVAVVVNSCDLRPAFHFTIDLSSLAERAHPGG